MSSPLNIFFNFNILWDLHKHWRESTSNDYINKFGWIKLAIYLLSEWQIKSFLLYILKISLIVKIPRHVCPLIDYEWNLKRDKDEESLAVFHTWWGMREKIVVTSISWDFLRGGKIASHTSFALMQIAPTF